MITLERVTKTFSTPDGPLVAVADASLQIDEGDIYGIIGFSGAGKSTLLRTINLLERPDPLPQTKITVAGREITKLSKHELNVARQSIGFVFQHFNLLNNRTVTENVAFPLEIAGQTKVERLARARECLEIVGLTDKANSYPSKLSGGQKQRVAIARAIANHPKVLLCDEPTSSVDPQMTSTILAFLRQINERFGLTIVLVTHEMAAVNAICNKVAVMEGGRVIERFALNDPSHQPHTGIARHLLRDRVEGATLLDDFIANI